ncbi:Hint domain-containing protein [Rhodococcus sp. AH-ZY2]|uniref:Hint domain-containing protein n=1 Tax=Rhodococcus sp. AH-ZY2 TaxID=3047468 RepID=UPI0027E177DB|nr:Hint domain-containing protein [Rhodococcus sp. AH-ZY2]WML63649.1 Hint domain-containing protein [Rhodococcus sp. AH-ZY2]
MLPAAASDHYSEQRRILAQVLSLARRIWGTRPPTDFDSWFDRNVELLVAAVAAGQRQAVAGADGYVEDVLDELGTPVAAAAEPVTAGLVGIASDGRELDSLMYGAVITSKRGIGQGLGLEDAWGLGMKALLLRVQTQVADAARVATGLSITVRPGVGYVRMLNPPSCPKCAVLAGKFYGHNRGFLRHPGCFPAGVTVSGPSAEASTRRWYEGELVVLTTSSGQDLSLTGNHPILTRRGWIPANFLQEGDYVVRSTRPEGATPLVVPNHNQVPTLIEDVWGSFAVNGLHRVPTAPEDFHGDGNVGEVDIVYPNRPLWGRDNATLGEHRVEQFFSGRSESSELLIEKGSSKLVGVRGLALSSSSVRGGGLELPFVWRQLRRSDLSGFLVAPDGHVCGDESFADDLARDSVLAGQGVLAGSGLVGGNDSIDGEFDSARWDAPALPFSVESRAGYASRGKELFDRLTGQVELDRVVVLRRVEWSGHVYNLTSSEGWHTANNLIVSNCDCRHIPTREDRADDVTTDPKAYFDSLTVEQQDKLFTRSGAEAIRAGADINQVVNADRGMATTQVYGRELATTTEGVTRRGLAYDAMRRAGYAQRDTDVRNGRYFQARAPRLMPEAIYEIAEDRADALRLLRLYGYLA